MKKITVSKLIWREKMLQQCTSQRNLKTKYKSVYFSIFSSVRPGQGKMWWKKLTVCGKMNCMDCSPLCKSKGCSNMHVIDSCWKVCICHCMFAVPMEIDGYPLLTFPNVCTQEPKAGSVFCGEHHQLFVRHQIPTKKEDFLKFLGCANNCMLILVKLLH